MRHRQRMAPNEKMTTSPSEKDTQLHCTCKQGNVWGCWGLYLITPCTRLQEQEINLTSLYSIMTYTPCFNNIRPGNYQRKIYKYKYTCKKTGHIKTTNNQTRLSIQNNSSVINICSAGPSEEGHQIETILSPLVIYKRESQKKWSEWERKKRHRTQTSEYTKVLHGCI